MQLLIYIFTYIRYNNLKGVDFVARKKFTTNLDEEVIRQLKIQAATENTNASKIIEKLLIQYLKKPAK